MNARLWTRSDHPRRASVLPRWLFSAVALVGLTGNTHAVEPGTIPIQGIRPIRPLPAEVISRSTQMPIPEVAEPVAPVRAAAEKNADPEHASVPLIFELPTKGLFVVVLPKDAAGKRNIEIVDEKKLPADGRYQGMVASAEQVWMDYHGSKRNMPGETSDCPAPKRLPWLGKEGEPDKRHYMAAKPTPADSQPAPPRLLPALGLPWAEISARSISFNFANATLGEIADFFGKASGVRFEIGEAGIRVPAAVAISARADSVSLKAGLHQVLEKFGWGYIVEGERVILSSPTAVQAKRQVDPALIAWAPGDPAEPPSLGELSVPPLPPAP